jgi:gamma-glutamylcysteine synthetase
MTDDTSGSASNVTITDDLRQKFPELVDLILKSESMNDEERQYWVNILPIMTPEQVQNLRNILDNEKKQLADIDKKYSAQIGSASDKELIERTDASVKKRRAERSEKEEEQERKEDVQTEDLLKKIEQL